MSRLQGCILLMLLCCLACTKENFLRYSNSDRVLDLVPTVPTTGLQFFSFAGDTITLTTKTQSNEFTSTSNPNQNVGGTSGLQNLELEKNMLSIGSDTPYFRFNYTVLAVPDATEGRGSIDVFSLNWLDDVGPMDSKIELVVSDSVSCADAACAFDTPLSFGNGNSFTNLYFTPRTAGTQTRLFINETQGLVAFMLASGQTYQRVP